VTRPDAILELTREIDKLRGENAVLRKGNYDLRQGGDKMKWFYAGWVIGIVIGASLAVFVLL
jgi:hypothetical protein